MNATCVKNVNAIRCEQQLRKCQPSEKLQATSLKSKTLKSCRQSRLAVLANTSSEDTGLSRRAALTLGSLSAASLSLGVPFSAPALADETQLYVDPVDNYSLKIPEDWEVGFGGAEGGTSQGTRRVVAFFPTNKAQSTNVTIVATNLSADYTKMGAFGNALEFGTRLVGSLDRSAVGKKPKFMRGSGEGDGTGQVCKLVNASEKNGMYNIEYTLSKKDEFNRHLYQVVGIGSGGAYGNRLYTVTAQVPEEELSSIKKTFDQILGSFVLPPKGA